MDVLSKRKPQQSASPEITTNYWYTVKILALLLFGHRIIGIDQLSEQKIIVIHGRICTFLDYLRSLVDSLLVYGVPWLVGQRHAPAGIQPLETVPTGP